MIILGLDLSLKATGCCIVSQSDKFNITTYLIKHDKTSGVEASIRRLLFISNEIVEIMNKHEVTHVVIEAPAMNQKWQASQIGELHGVVKATILVNKKIIPYVEQATRLRKAVVGELKSKRAKVKNDKGKMVSKVDYGLVPGKKPGTLKKATIKDIIEYRLSEQGLKFPTQDEMDAYVAARYLWDFLND
jgi:Holliday junction resolvasome RuvABC endonuclease subunit